MYRCPLPRPGQVTDKAHFNLTYMVPHRVFKRDPELNLFLFYVKSTGQFI